ncbi:MAG: enoyl-ACP reductase [Halobacteriovoraceae bacterium]|nr:enoyl-ACP reductase [Halobacteriovoraceae bacterium]
MLDFTGQTYLITGVANKKSVAYFSAKTLSELGAITVFTVQTEEHKTKVQKLFPDSQIIICDVENKEHFEQLTSYLKQNKIELSGILHSMAYANFNPERSKYHETSLEDFMQAAHISCFSLNQFAQACLPSLKDNSSLVTVGISNTKATSYGYLGPIKAMLETSVCYLAKSLSEIKKIRVNCVSSGPLKTSASAGIPNYIENFLYAEALTLRQETLHTQEVANTICFLLSEKSSGINAETIVVDAGMSSNYFDQKIVKNFAKDL